MNWLLPEGIDELTPPHAQRLELVRRKLADVYRSWGYQLCMPPVVERLEALLSGAAQDLSSQTVKFTDPLDGQLLGIRADMTPQVARIDARRLAQSEHADGPNRLCYFGSTLRANREAPGASRNPIQVGAELFGVKAIEADLEIIALMLETLTTLGFEKTHVDVGHVGLFRAAAKAAGLHAEAEAEVFELLRSKEPAALADWLSANDIKTELAESITALANLHGDISVLEQLPASLRGLPGVPEAIDELKTVFTAVAARNPQVSLTLDAGELRGYSYHTGLVFSAYVPGYGREIMRGGRYNNVGESFGRARAATGFSANLRTLVRLAPAAAALPETTAAILAPCSSDTVCDEALEARIDELRAAGEVVVRAMPNHSGNNNCTRKLVQQQGEWQLADLPASPHS